MLPFLRTRSVSIRNLHRAARRATSEILEARRLLAAVNWDAGGDGVNWTDSLNWSTDALPGSADDVTVDVAGAPTIQISSGTQSVRSLTCNENLSLGFATLDLALASTVNGNFSQGAGTVSGAGNLTINGTFDWAGGAQQGSGHSIVPAGRTMNITGSGGIGRVLDLSGTGNISGTPFFGNGLGANGTLNVLPGGVLNLTTGSFINSNGGTAHALNNDGTINRSGAGTTTFSGSITTITNNGTINVDAGELAFSGTPLVQNGSIANDAGTTLNLGSNTSYSASSTITGPGPVTFSGGTHTLDAGNLASGSDVTMVGFGTIVNFNTPMSLSALTLATGGAASGLGGSADVTINGTLNWSSGAMRDSGRTILPAGRTANLSGFTNLCREFDLAGHGILSPSAFFFFGDGTATPTGTFKVQNGGVLDINTDGFINSNGGVNHQLINDGIINRSGSGTTTFSSAVTTITNNGTFNLDTGAISVQEALVNNGTIAIDPGTSITFAKSGTYAGGSNLTGTGDIAFTEGTHNFSAGAFTATGGLSISGPTTVNFNGNVSLSGLVHNGGTLGGSGNIAVNGTYTWNAGSMGGTGTTTLAAGRNMTLSTPNQKQLGRRLDIAGTATYDGTFFNFGDASGANGAMNILPGGTLNLVGDGDMSANGGTAHTMSNSGTINRTGTGTTTALTSNTIAVTNNGTINVTEGTLEVRSLVNNGAIAVAAGSTIALTNLASTHSPGSSLSGGGSASFFGGTHSFAANSYGLTGALSVEASVVTMGAGGTVPIRTNALTIGVNSKLDLNDNDLLFDYTGASPMTTIRNLINAARHGGLWDGTGLSSTAAKNANPQNTTLGALEATEFKSVYGPSATFDGQAIDDTAVLIKYTYYGDTDFNGRVNFDDYVRTDYGFNEHKNGWLNGDSDGNGVVNFDDYVLIDLAFNSQTTVLGRRGQR
jgi:hypothetical protein